MLSRLLIVGSLSLLVQHSEVNLNAADRVRDEIGGVARYTSTGLKAKRSSPTCLSWEIDGSAGLAGVRNIRRNESYEMGSVINVPQGREQLSAGFWDRTSRLKQLRVVSGGLKGLK